MSDRMNVLELAPYAYIPGIHGFERNPTGFGRMVWTIAQELALSKTVSLLTCSFCSGSQAQGVNLVEHTFLEDLRSLHKTDSAWLRGLRDRRTRKYWAYMSYGLRSGAIARAASEPSIELLHVHGVSPGVWPMMRAALNSHKPLMVTMHGLNFCTESVPFAPGERAFEAALIKTLNEQGILLTCVSSGVKWTIEQEIGPVDADRIRVIPNGVDLAVTPRRNRDDERARLGLSPEAVVIANVGSMDKRRDQALLLRAFALLGKEHPHWRCAIAGDGPLKGELIHLADELGLSNSVSFLGQIPHEDVIALLNAADICTVSSTNEGFRLLMLEARSVGTPVVTFADLEAVHDLYDPDAMVLVNAHKPSDLRDGFLQAADRKWDRTKIRGSMDQFGLASMGAQYDEAARTAAPMKCSLVEFENRLLALAKEYGVRVSAKETAEKRSSHG